MIKKLDKKQLTGLINQIRGQYQLYLPTEKKDGLFLFEQAVDVDLSTIGIEAPLTMVPPTDFLLPFKEEIFNFERGQYLENDLVTKRALVGIKNSDMEAINRLKIIFENDALFNKNLDNTLTVVVDSEHLSVYDQIMIDRAIEGYDLKISQIGSNYLIFSDSQLGDEILSAYTEVSPYQDETLTREVRNNNTALNIGKIKWAIENTRPDPKDKQKGKVWQKWAKVCLGCGNCSYVCPMCFCYQLCDKIDLDGKIVRKRKRSSCYLYSFDKMAGGNPKSQFVDRFYHWYYHKFVSMPTQYGFTGCVNCGRCIKYCPVDINFRTVISEAIEEAENG